MKEYPLCTLCRKYPSYTSKIDHTGILYFLCANCVDEIKL
jgi:hypothetical protein